MRISILPKAALSWWSVGLVLASLLLFVVSQAILGLGPDFNMPLAYGLTAVLAAIAVAAFVTGLISVIRRKERSIIVFLAMAISLYSLIGGTVAVLGLAK